MSLGWRLFDVSIRRCSLFQSNCALTQRVRHYGTRPEEPPAGRPANLTWEEEPQFQAHKFNRGMPERKDLKVGPYKRGRFFVSPREDPTTFIVNCLIIGVTVYTLMSLSKGEPITVRRKRIIRERLLKEYGLTEADVDGIEGMDVPISSSNETMAPNAGHV